MEYQRVEVITGTPRRRRYTAEEKADAVMDSLAPGASIANVARRRGICRSLLFRWRQLAQASTPCQPGVRAGPSFVPVMLEAPAQSPAPCAPETAASCGAMEIVLADGRSLRFDASIDAEALTRVLKALQAA